jgi:hypothetical protein
MFNKSTLENIEIKENISIQIIVCNSNHFLNSSFTKFEIFSIESLILTLIYGFIFLFGIFSNIVVIFVYIINKDFKKHTNYFFISLSISDLLILVICIPIAINDIWSPNIWYFGIIYCKFINVLNFYFKLKKHKIKLKLGKLYYFSEYFFTSASSFTIILISIERYIAIANPLKVLIFIRIFEYFLILKTLYFQG